MAEFIQCLHLHVYSYTCTGKHTLYSYSYMYTYMCILLLYRFPTSSHGPFFGHITVLSTYTPQTNRHTIVLKKRKHNKHTHVYLQAYALVRIYIRCVCVLWDSSGSAFALGCCVTSITSSHLYLEMLLLWANKQHCETGTVWPERRGPGEGQFKGCVPSEV